MISRVRIEILAALAFAVASVAAVLIAAVATRPPDRQTIVRLLERCLDDDARFEWSAEPVTEEVRAPIQRWRFRGHRSAWLLLDELGQKVKQGERGASTWTPVKMTGEGTPPEGVLRFPMGRGALAHVIPSAPLRLLRLSARVRRMPTKRTLASGAEARQAVLIVQPLRKSLDLARELDTRPYVEVVNDPHWRVDKDALWASAPTLPSGQFETLSLDFLTPPGTEALLFLFGAGDGTTMVPVDLQEIALEDLSLRGFLELGATAPEATPLARTAPIDRREIPLLPPPDPKRPVLRRVDELLERRDALVLPPPSKASFEIDLPSAEGGELVLEHGLARIREPRANWGRGTIEIAVRVEPAEGGGPTVEASEILEPGGASGWQDRTLDLTELAGRRVRFHYSASSASSASSSSSSATPPSSPELSTGSTDLVAVGAPLVRRRSSRDERPCVVIVSLDTVRADHLSCEGYPRPTTPRIDELARDAAWFRDASSTSSYTLPAHASLLTGQLPSRHGAESEAAGRNFLWSDRSELLALRLREESFSTAAFTGGVYLAASYGFDQGFDRYDATDLALEPDDPRARRTPVDGDPEFNARHRKSREVDHALEWMRARADGPFFLFLHTYVVHDYLASGEHEARFHGSCASTLARGNLSFIRDRTIQEKPAADLDHFVDGYDAALHSADAVVGRVVDTLRELGRLDRTILVVTSDHGEEFGDHGGVSHGRTLHEEMLRVPLFVRAPGLGPREVRTPVSLVDVTPTVLELAGLEPRLAHAIDGRSLVPLLRGEELEPVALEAELNLVKENRWIARREGGRKAIGVTDERNEKELTQARATRSAARREVFAPPLDRGETVDLAEDDASLLEELELQRERMRARRDEARRTAAGAHPASARSDLRGVGYIDVPDETESESEDGE